MNDRQNMLNSITRQEKGFTLVELIIVVAILGILGMIAIPFYRQYAEKAQRSAASAVIESFPLLLETYRADNGMMCPNCNINGTHTYNYTEDDTGTITTDTIKINYPEFKPKPPTQKVSLYDYQLVVTVAGCPGACVESAVITALPKTNLGAPAGYMKSDPIK